MKIPRASDFSASARFPHLVLCSLVLAISCSAPSTRPDRIPLDLEKADAQRILGYYFGSYVTEPGVNPFESGLLSQEQGITHISLSRLDELGVSPRLEDFNKDGRISWEELEPFLTATYYQVRSFPRTLDMLRLENPYLADSSWMLVEIDGMMTTARRRIYIHPRAIRAALDSYLEHDKHVIYPVGTTIIAEHYEGEAHLETTVSRKRGDLFWDYFIYDQQGALTSSTVTGPKELTTPTHCVGCHFGNKPFEPEISFPAQAPDGPFGPRGIRVDQSMRDSLVADFFDEHRKRSDTILGPYATLYVSQLRYQIQLLSREDSVLLDRLGL